MPELNRFILKRNDAQDFSEWLNKNGLYQFKVVVMERPSPSKPFNMVMEYYGDETEFEDRLFELSEGWANHKNWKTPRIPRMEPKENP